MKPWQALLRMAAVASSLALVSWYVYDRAKATSPPQMASMLPGSKVKAPVISGENSSTPERMSAPTTLPGPKSAPVFVPGRTEAPQSPSATTGPVDPKPSTGASQVSMPAPEWKVKAATISWPPAQPSTVILPGSKSTTPVISVPFGGWQTEASGVQMAGNATVTPQASQSSEQGGQTPPAILPGSKSFAPIINVGCGTMQALPPVPQTTSRTPANGPTQSAIQFKTPPAPQSKVVLPRNPKP